MNTKAMKNTNTKQIISEIISKGVLSQVPISKISLNPKNYRKFYAEKSLEEFAQQLKRHGILSSLIVRPVEKDSYELIVGERRLRAAHIAGIGEIPVKIVQLNDEQVLEIQLDENFSRENPHPLDDSNAIRMMQDFGYNIEEISLRLGKSKGFIYNRIKLSELNQEFKQMFMNNVLNIQTATELAGLDPDSQTEFFEKYCKDWEDEGIDLEDCYSWINQYKLNLEKAPFDIKDKNLVEKAGACTDCPYNSATINSLFPEMEKSSVCSNKKCFWTKCTSSLENSIAAILLSGQIEILIKPYRLSDIEAAALEKFPDLQELPCKEFYDLDRCEMPAQPKKEAFMVDSKLDNKAFTEAVTAYKSKLKDFEFLLESGDVKKALRINNNKATPLYYYTSKSKENSNGVTAKEVQEAKKNGTATPELLQQEIERIEKKEKRDKELDEIKIFEKLHKSFLAEYCNLKNTEALTKADQVASMWIIMECLPYGKKQDVIKALFPKTESFSLMDKSKQYQAVSKLTDKQFAYLIRVVLSGLSECKNPSFATSQYLYNVAIDAGMDVKAIEAEQGAIAKIRQKRVKERIAEVNSDIDKLLKTKKLIA
ncbi:MULTISPECIES: ParB/RepB/Spo0J family partition protein [Sphingobacterium]|uniref:ParB/RepB/Spo0J family partition protein n=1 Tax=Sphingobacterium TaxID=28453 RepID=UPI0028A970F3|nr:ParB/RepB/Spo0J family partition protein [Sphingobacterium multivorum]